MATKMLKIVIFVTQLSQISSDFFFIERRIELTFSNNLYVIRHFIVQQINFQ